MCKRVLVCGGSASSWASISMSPVPLTLRVFKHKHFAKTNYAPSQYLSKTLGKFYLKT